MEDLRKVDDNIESKDEKNEEKGLSTGGKAAAVIGGMIILAGGVKLVINKFGDKIGEAAENHKIQKIGKKLDSLDKEQDRLSKKIKKLKDKLPKSEEEGAKDQAPTDKKE